MSRAGLNASSLKAADGNVRYAYRLLLGHEPDTDGFRHYCEMARAGSPGVVDIVRTIMISAEYFARKTAGAGDIATLRSTESNFSLGWAIR